MMGGCRISSAMTFCVPLEPAPLCTTPRQYFSDGEFWLKVIFDTAMDQTVTPSLTSWEVKKAAVELTVLSQTWLDSTSLKIVFQEDPTSTPLQVKLLIADNYLRSNVTKAMVQPFGPYTFTFSP